MDVVVETDDQDRQKDSFQCIEFQGVGQHAFEYFHEQCEDRSVEDGLFIEFLYEVSEGEGETDPGESGGQCQIGVSRKCGGEILYKNIGG